MRASMNGLPMHLRKAIRDLIAAGGRVTRDGNCLSIDGPAAAADAVRAHAGELAQYVVPSVTAEEAKLVRGLLADAGASVAYVTAPDAARQIVAGIVAGAPDVIGAGLRDRSTAGISTADSNQVQQGRKSRRQTAARWRGRCCA